MHGTPGQQGRAHHGRRQRHRRRGGARFCGRGREGGAGRDLARGGRGDRDVHHGGRRRGALRRDRCGQARAGRARGAGDGRRIRRAPRALQQRRRSDAAGRQGDRDGARRVLAHDRRRSLRHVPRLPVRHPGHARGRRRLDHQHHLDPRPDRYRRRRCLQRRQGRRARSDQGAGPAVGGRRHPRQRDRARRRGDRARACAAARGRSDPAEVDHGRERSPSTSPQTNRAA